MANPTLDLPRLRPDQWEIVKHPAKVKCCACGRRWGKTVMVGAVEVAAAAAGCRCAWGAPSYRNTRPLWRWAEKVCRPLVASGQAVINRAERVIEFPTTGGFLGIYSLDNPDAVRGEAFHLWAIDEAARVEEEAWTDVIQPTLADYDGEAFLISTPKGRNWFWQLYTEGLQDGKYVKSFTAPSSANPMPTIQKAFLLAQERMPEKTFQQEWLAEFIEDALALFLPSYFENRFNPLGFRPYNPAIARYISWDTGLKDTDGNAFSAAVVGDLMPDYRLLTREVYRERLNFPSLIEKIANLAYAWGQDGVDLRDIVIEDKASGTSAYQTLVSSSDPWLASRVRAFTPTGGKSQRAAQAGVWCKNGSVVLPEPRVLDDGRSAVPWLVSFEDELYKAPKSTYMDQVDAFSQLILWVEQLLRTGLQARKNVLGEFADLIAPSTPTLEFGGRFN